MPTSKEIMLKAIRKKLRGIKNLSENVSDFIKKGHLNRKYATQKHQDSFTRITSKDDPLSIQVPILVPEIVLPTKIYSEPQDDLSKEFKKILFQVLTSDDYNLKKFESIPLLKVIADKNPVIEYPEWIQFHEWKASQCSTEEDWDFFKNKDHFLDKMVILSKDFHSDFFILWKINSKYYYFSLSSRWSLFRITKEEHEKCQCSTDISKAYYENYWNEKRGLKQGTSKERMMIKEILRNLGGSLEVCIELPENREERISVTNGNQLKINLNKRNFHYLVGKENADHLLNLANLSD
eukprot:gene2792-4200_t